jgi:carbonic anhydrase
MARLLFILTRFLQPGTCTFNDMFYELTNTGVKASFPATCENPKVKIPGLDGLYQALQFHIHTSSEHTINNEFFGAELHIVHQKVDGDRYAVVGMMIDPTADEPNENFGTLLSEWGSVFANQDAGCAIQRSGRERQRQRVMLQEPQDPRELQGTGVFNPYALLPEGVTYYYYDGGLTTPPCSQVVWWNLADAPVKITPGQYWQLTNQILNFVDPSTCQLATNAGPAGSTSRPVQPLNGRSVERVCPAGFGVGTDEAVTKCEDVDPPVTTLPIPDVPVPSSVDDEEVTEDGASHMGLLGAVAVMAATLFL